MLWALAPKSYSPNLPSGLWLANPSRIVSSLFSSSTAFSVNRITPEEAGVPKATSIAAPNSVADSSSGSLIVWMIGQVGLLESACTCSVTAPIQDTGCPQSR